MIERDIHADVVSHSARRKEAETGKGDCSETRKFASASWWRQAIAQRSRVEDDRGRRACIFGKSKKSIVRRGPLPTGIHEWHLLLSPTSKTPPNDLVSSNFGPIRLCCSGRSRIMSTTAEDDLPVLWRVSRRKDVNNSAIEYDYL